MKLLFLLTLIFLTPAAQAGSLTSKIHSIDTSNKKGVPHLILLENGSVVFLNYEETAELQSFRESLRQQDTIKIEVDEKNNFLSSESLLKKDGFMPLGTTKSALAYVPTVVNSGTAATAIFRRMRRDYQYDSQCYNRAHVWAYEEFLNSGLLSTKHFLFFTRRYIRNYRFKWWFHVSPSVAVSGYSTERILDRRYTGGHRSLSSWTRNFIYSGRTCPIVEKYYDYRNNQETEDCYLIPVSMYFWQPRDIERRDRTGFEKTSFNPYEVDYAYWEAF
jgi:hypothetical protein